MVVAAIADPRQQIRFVEHLDTVGDRTDPFHELYLDRGHDRHRQRTTRPVPSPDSRYGAHMHRVAI
jgi:hypothetical protein